MNYLRQFQYNEEILGRYIDVLSEHPDSPEKVRRLMSHMLNALEIWVSRIEHREAECETWEEHETSTLHALNRKCHDAIFHLLETGNLKKSHAYVNSEGQAFSNTLDEVLTHLVIHSAHHRAQIATLWSDAGIKPPPCDFIFWARQSR